MLDRIRREFKAWLANIRPEEAEDIRKLHGDMEYADYQYVVEQLQECLQDIVGKDHDAAKWRANAIGHKFVNGELNEKGREKFLYLLAHEFTRNHDLLKDGPVKKYLSAPDEQRDEAAYMLYAAMESSRHKILKQFNDTQGGITILIAMRQELMPFIKAERNPKLKAKLNDLMYDLEDVLQHSVGECTLVKVEWENKAHQKFHSKLAEYDKVRPFPEKAAEREIALRQRIARTDRRVFAVVHPSSPEDPLGFIEVALGKGPYRKVQDVLDPGESQIDPRKADTATFYAVVNPHNGMLGMGLAEYLVKRAAREVAREYPNIKDDKTLSPMDGFRSWFDAQMKEKGERLLTGDEAKTLQKIAGSANLYDALQSKWRENDSLRKAIDPILERNAAYFATRVKDKKRLVYSVGHFHCKNGAALQYVTGGGDVSAKGMKDSYGVSATLDYTGDLKQNAAQYKREGKVPASKEIGVLADKAEPFLKSTATLSRAG